MIKPLFNKLNSAYKVLLIKNSRINTNWNKRKQLIGTYPPPKLRETNRLLDKLRDISFTCINLTAFFIDFVFHALESQLAFLTVQCLGKLDSATTFVHGN